MKVLCACEESQAVTIEMRRLGHEAYSCDLQECSGGHPEWHIMGDVIPMLNGRCRFWTMDGSWHEIDGRWDMIIGFPPCTKTSNAGARHLYKGGKLNLQRYFDGMCGKAFFLTLWHADCDKIVLENPVPSKVFEYPEPTQSIQPHHYGHPFTKKNTAVGEGCFSASANGCCGTNKDMVPVWQLFRETRREAQKHVYDRSSKKPF